MMRQHCLKRRKTETMGWGSGSELMSRIIRDLNKRNAPPAVREMVYGVLIPAFEAQDWDTQDDCLDEDPVFDKVLEAHYDDRNL